MKSENFLKNTFSDILEPSGSFVDLTDVAENSKNLIFASAASDDHYQNEVGTISAIYKYYPDAKFILYSLGLQAANISKLKSMFKNLEVRVFNTTGYPDYTNHWMEYRFKPLLLAELLREHSNIWWMDAHLSVKKPNMVELMMKEVADNTKKAETKVVGLNVKLKLFKLKFSASLHILLHLFQPQQLCHIKHR